MSLESQPSSPGVSTARTVALFLCGLVLLAYGVQKHQLFSSAPNLEYGAQLPELELTGASGERLDLRPGQWYFLIVGAEEDDLSLVRYLEGLRDRPELQMSELTPVILVEGDMARAAEFVTGLGDGVLRDVVVPLHQFAARDLRQLGIDSHDTRYVLLTPQLTVAFVSSFLKDKDLRQLLEAHIPGRRTVEARRSARKLEPGDRFEAFDGGSADEALVLVFTSDCTSCVLENRMRAVAAAETALRRWESAGDRRVSLLFGSSFVRREVERQAASIGLTLPLQVVDAPLQGIEDPYRRVSLFDDDLVVLNIHRETGVSTVQTFDELLERLRLDADPLL